MKSVRSSRGWTRAAVAALAGALTLGLAACGSGSDEAGGGGEPVTIAHAQGETTINGVPERVVTLGNQWLDSAQVLGVQPVGYIDNVAVIGKGVTPWEPESLKQAKALDTTGNVVEQVAALAPDLILVDAFLADAKMYGDLSKVAPTIPSLSKDAVGAWPDQVRALGKVLHKDEAAEKVVTDLNARIEAIGKKNPTLAGKTFVSSWLASPAQLMVLTDAKDPSAALFTQQGMTVPAGLAAQGGTGGRLSLSPERLDELNADLVLAGYSPGMDEKWKQLPGYNDLPSVKKNSLVFLTVQEITAVNQPTPLSLPYVLDKLEPAFANAAK
ncbi:ABC transporter substrate-binding protein [Nocardia sp. NPDC003693]